MEDGSQEPKANKRKRTEESGSTAVHDSSQTQAFTNQALDKAGRSSEQRHVAATFGQTQGAAGAAVPEDPEQPQPAGPDNKAAKQATDPSTTSDEGLRAPDSVSEGTGPSDDQTSGFELGIVAIEDKLHDGDWAGADAALVAADKAKAKAQGDREAAVIEALEKAETSYEEGKRDPESAQGSMTQRISERLGTDGNAQTVPQSAPKRLGALQMSDTDRQKIRDRMMVSLQKSPFVSQLSKDQQQTEIDSLELAIYQKCSSRPVYISKAGNLSRLLSKLSSRQELDDLPRIASGVSKQVMQDFTSDGKPRRDTTGLQGIVPK